MNELRCKSLFTRMVFMNNKLITYTFHLSWCGDFHVLQIQIAATDLTVQFYNTHTIAVCMQYTYIISICVIPSHAHPHIFGVACGEGLCVKTKSTITNWIFWIIYTNCNRKGMNDEYTEKLNLMFRRKLYCLRWLYFKTADVFRPHSLSVAHRYFERSTTCT